MIVAKPVHPDRRAGSDVSGGASAGLASTTAAEPATARTCPLRLLTRDKSSAGTVSLAGIATMTYGLLAYASFFVTILYSIGFVADRFVPKSIDSGTPQGLMPSLLINTGLLLVFVLQHTIMARPRFKQAWTRVIPAAIERSTFVIAASASLGLVFWQWRPLPEVVWHVSHTGLATALTALSLLGWAIVFASSFMVSHFDLFGLRQTWFRFRERSYVPVGFRLVGLYKLVRHPLMVGFLIAFWATPSMTVGHLFFAVMVTGYIFAGTWIEERDLIAAHPDEYHAYRRQVRGLLPIPRRTR